MKPKLPLTATFLLVISTAAYAGSWAERSTFGVGVKSCSDWLKDRRGPSHLWSEDVSWMFGFMTALGRVHGPSDVGGLAPEDFPGEVDQICAANSKMSLAEAAEVLGVKHKLIAPPPD